MFLFILNNIITVFFCYFNNIAHYFLLLSKVALWFDFWKNFRNIFTFCLWRKMTLRNNTEKTKKTPDFRRPFVYDFKASLFCGITRRAFRKRQTAPRFLTVHTFCLQNIRLHCFTKRRLSLRENYLLSNIPSCFVQKKNAYCACVLTLCSYVFQP